MVSTFVSTGGQDQGTAPASHRSRTIGGNARGQRGFVQTRTTTLAKRARGFTHTAEWTLCVIVWFSRRSLTICVSGGDANHPPARVSFGTYVAT